MAVHLSPSPPDGFESWTDEDWERWLMDAPLEPAEYLAERSDWFVFLYMARVHARSVESDLAPFMERLIVEKPIRSTEIESLREALAALRRALDAVPASRLWTGTQFYTADYLYALILRKEKETGRRGLELRVSDLWLPLFDALDSVLERARCSGRGVYFGRV